MIGSFRIASKSQNVVCYENASVSELRCLSDFFECNLHSECFQLLH